MAFRAGQAGTANDSEWHRSLNGLVSDVVKEEARRAPESVARNETRP
jgi:hypothetical protein